MSYEMRCFGQKIQYINLVLKPLISEDGGWSQSVIKFSCKNNFNSDFSKLKNYLILSETVFSTQSFCAPEIICCSLVLVGV